MLTRKIMAGLTVTIASVIMLSGCSSTSSSPVSSSTPTKTATSESYGSGSTTDPTISAEPTESTPSQQSDEVYLSSQTVSLICGLVGKDTLVASDVQGFRDFAKKVESKPDSFSSASSLEDTVKSINSYADTLQPLVGKPVPAGVKKTFSDTCDSAKKAFKK